MDLTIRQVSTSDLDELFKLVQKFATSYTPNKDIFMNIAHELLKEESVYLRIAETEGKIIGYCLGFDHYTFYANGRVSWLEEIMVEESERNKGTGTKLMESFEEWSKSRNSHLIALATRRAGPFYLELGYEDSAVYFRKQL